MDKKYLEELWLAWSQDAKDHFMNSQSEMDILGKLQPSKYLKRLGIDGYMDTRFPKWAGDPSYHNLTKLSLYRCHNCCILPPLGQLRSLKDLRICAMSMLETIGSEYGDSFPGILFPSHECLEFSDMPCWEVWHHSHESHDSFPVLKSLVIVDCPKLHGDLPSHLPVVETIKIERCNQFDSSLPRAPAICKLYITGSNKVSLNELPLSLEELNVGGRVVTKSVFEAIGITPPISLQKLAIKDCSSAITMDCRGLLHPKSLQCLTIHFCPKLENMVGERLPASLIKLQIFRCPLLEERCLKKHSNLAQNFPTFDGLRLMTNGFSKLKLGF